METLIELVAICLASIYVGQLTKEADIDLVSVALLVAMLVPAGFSLYFLYLVGQAVF